MITINYVYMHAYNGNHMEGRTGAKDVEQLAERLAGLKKRECWDIRVSIDCPKHGVQELEQGICSECHDEQLDDYFKTIVGGGETHEEHAERIERERAWHEIGIAEDNLPYG